MVFHCASPAPASDDRALFQRVNIDGTRTVLQACHEAGVQVRIISLMLVSRWYKYIYTTIQKFKARANK